MCFMEFGYGLWSVLKMATGYMVSPHYVLFEGLKSLEQPWRRRRVRPTLCFTFPVHTLWNIFLFDYIFKTCLVCFTKKVAWLSRLSPQEVEIRFWILVRCQVFAICPMTLSNPLPEAKWSDPFFSDWSPVARIISSEGFTISTALSKLYSVSSNCTFG